MAGSGYLASPWPAEDASPLRMQAVHGSADLGLQAGERLACTSRRTLLSTMTVLGEPGEVFLLTHSALRARLGMPTTACVERIDPVTLRPLARSVRLKGGPMWPGGMAVHRNGRLVVVYGRHAHLLDRHCQRIQTQVLPVAQAYNSFVVLDNGLIVTKNLSDQTPAHLTVLEPDRLEPVGPTVVGPEPSIARLSADGNTVYVVGVHSIFRYHWSDATQSLVRDEAWRCDYRSGTAQTWAWDVVLDGQDAWFMDNGQHRYVRSMLRAGVSRSPNRLIRVSLADATDHHAVEVSGLPGGSITNPPLVDTSRRIVVAYDSANAVMRAWRIVGPARQLQPLWTRSPLGCASHMILYPESGELVTNDYRQGREDVVVLDIESGAERGRVCTGGWMQGVVFPSVGWGRDFYWSSMDRLTRVFVQ